MNAKNIFGAICVAAALFFLWPAVFGSWAQMQALRAAVKEREALIAERESILKDVATQQERLQAVKSGALANVFASFVPTKRNAAELVSATSTIAAESGLQLTSLEATDASGAKSKDPYVTTSITMELSGQYSALRTFLRDLESYVRLLNIRSLEISPGGSEGGLKFSIEADTYYIK